MLDYELQYNRLGNPEIWQGRCNMRERVYRCEAIIVRRSDFSEADRLLLLATPEGKRRVVAKGVRKTMNKLAGHLELFTHCSLQLAVGRNLDIVTQSHVRQPFTHLRTDLNRLAYGYYIAELFDKCTQEEEENRPLFELLLSTLNALDSMPSPELVVRWYEIQLAGLLGYRPHFHRCAVCQELLTEEANRFSTQLGGMLCPKDGNSDRQASVISLGAFKVLRYLQTNPLSNIEQLQISEPTRDEVKTVLRSYLRHILERDFKTVAFLEEITGM